MKTCEDVLDVLPDALPWIRGEALELYDHLKVCIACSDAVEETARTVEALREFAPEAPQPAADFADRVMAALPAATPTPLRVSSPPWAIRAAAAVALFAAGLAVGGLNTEPGVVARRADDGGPALVDESTDADAPVDASAPKTLVPVPVATVSDEGGDSLSDYAAEASLVLEAVDSLETSDPDVLRLLSFHVQRKDLLKHGDLLLGSIRSGGQDDAGLEPLISGTQLILRKVRHARAESAPQTLWTIREEVRRTGILDAYRQLLTANTATITTNPNDPL